MTNITIIRQVIVMVFLWRCVPSKGTDLNCASPHSNNFKFSIISLRNSTGHWNAQVELKHGVQHSALQDKALGPWEVEIDHTTSKCDDSESVVIMAALSAPSQPPGPGYEFISGLGFYKFHFTPKNWFVARRTCAQEGAHLAIVNSHEEFVAIKIIWEQQPKIGDWRDSVVHIGIHDFFTEGQYLTIFNKPLNTTGYEKWAPGQPSGGRKEQCATLERTGFLHDAVCEHEFSYFCEQELR